MKRLTILGIDGLDRRVFDSCAADLPNLSKCENLAEEYGFVSVFPPDTDAAWPSFYTGLPPSGHGIFEFSDPGHIGPQPRSREPIQGKTFWDVASRRGLRCCICLPHGIYPGWDIKGTMVTLGRTNSKKGVDLSFTGDCVDLDLRVDARDLRGVTRFVREGEARRVISRLQSKYEAEARLALDLHAKQKWDIFFAYFSVADAIQHNFWHRHDSSHPAFHPDSEYRDTVRAVYRRYDDLVGSFLDRAEPGECVLIISDHGHGRRPTMLLNLNEVLRQAGLLRTLAPTRDTKKVGRSIRRVIVSSYVSRFGAPPFANALARMVPALKRDPTASATVDYAQSQAYLCTMPSMKGYNYGGVRICARDPIDRERKVERVIATLENVREPVTGSPLVTCIIRREELKPGPYLEEFPDLLIETHDDYGLAGGTHCPVIERGFMHRVQSGSHKRLTPVLFARELGDVGHAFLAQRRDPTSLTLMDAGELVKAFADGRLRHPPA